MSPVFHFRLEPVLDVRRRREELVQGEYAQAIQAVAAQQERAVEARHRLAEATEAMREGAQGPIHLLELRGLSEEIARLRRVAEHERDMADRLERIAEERREDLVRASRDREALDTLRRRALEQHRLEEIRREQIVLDELATRRAARAGRPTTGAAA